MIITHKVKIDLERAGAPRQVDMVQDDQYSRNLELSMYTGSTPWEIPKDASIRVSYRKPDGHGGVYDILPDRTRAWSIDGNIATVAIAPQVCTVAGTTMLAVTMVLGKSELSTHIILINVKAKPGAGYESEDYVSLKNFLPQPSSPASVGQLIKVSSIDSVGNITGLETADEYSLPIAGPETLGGVSPVEKTEDMTQEVGVDETGRMFTAPAKEFKLPVASSDTLGGVKASPKTEEMTQPVGVDENGMLFAVPSKDNSPEVQENLDAHIADKQNPHQVTAVQVKADPEGTADNRVASHNVSPDSHNDIRLLVKGLTDRLNALADSDDTTLDQLSEIVAYIKSNKELIDSITTSKVNVSDIINNLETNAPNKPLSAAMGVELKRIIDNISVLPVPGVASAGQILRVLEVDGDGKITALEAVTSAVTTPVTMAEYNALIESGQFDPAAVYMIVSDEA